MAKKDDSNMSEGDMDMDMDQTEMKELMNHLQNHVMYPASKRTIVESCNKMEHVPASTRMWAEQKLPEGTYMSADEVVMKLGM
jgi:sialic acid synthase SpsE